jgi:hypothetical protein
MKPRNYGFENELCQAITRRNLVEVHYKNDFAARVFEPYIVFEEPGTKNITVAGYQNKNPNKPTDPREWHKFTTGLIMNLKVLAGTFRPDPVFSSFDSNIYGFNVISAVDR